MFLLPTPEGELEGSSDEKPIYLHGIKANEFRPFLRVLFKRCVDDVFVHI